MKNISSFGIYTAMSTLRLPHPVSSPNFDLKVRGRVHHWSLRLWMPASDIRLEEQNRNCVRCERIEDRNV
ncbi:unnamed protein product [Cylicostephanus goldi]|uniref:Uncharacterized protein n=1 Tax=Cylicostephanus goldi TaxID=71465 RepID=A0A3P6TDM4_CYLGO|nr:unnamed protein product [Cylicostephanus goldi]